jgi:hypothetical protein
MGLRAYGVLKRQHHCQAGVKLLLSMHFNALLLGFERAEIIVRDAHMVDQ